MATVMDLALGKAGQVMLVAAAGVSIISELVNSAEGGSLTGVVQNLVQVGGPCALGAAASYAIYKPDNTSKDVKHWIYRGALAGGIATGVLIYSGAMPPVLDVATLSFVALVGGATVLSEFIVLGDLRWNFGSA